VVWDLGIEFGRRVVVVGDGEGMMRVCYGLYTLEARIGRDLVGMGEEEWSINAVTCWQRILGMNIRYCTHYVHLAELYHVLSHVRFRNYDTITSRTSKHLTSNQNAQYLREVSRS
jgi:hypothetical protein